MTSPGSGDAPKRQRVAVYGLCTNEAGDLLLVRAAAHLTVAGRWFLPGGGVDHGEEPTEALRREFAEETGLDATVGPLLGVLSDNAVMPDGTDLHTVRIIYRIESYAGILRDEAEGTSDVARFFAVDELADLPLMPYGVRALAEFAGIGGSE